jgi:hypothetical protein
MTTPMSEARLKICNSCEFNVLGDCALCGCLIATKVLDPNEKCPAGQSRWPSITAQPTGADLINRGVCVPCQKNR